ncbi:hypothetical protein GKE82_20285 [Conexibacter sp. W3-3-2]|uniref:Alkaline phosphatase n=1 Tax=Paraconexibacter algicola TaxID=2133960 RepID=A0A2T4ULR4_9ACTN|nr:MULTISPECIES: alkaline phosphatase D family protein [Solirubrobacterales]MTD46562.1 hypothetical protein [Conexibacter sp. W3-3-2]PTL60202.1 hypothetical protein C7Y72_11420 [Paraconexibacter algicola]
MAAFRPDDPALTRRELLLAGGAAATTTIALGALNPAQTAAAKRLAREAALPAGTFPSGVASGQPFEHGITLWTRVGDVERSGRLRLEIARDADFARVVHRQDVRAAAVRDHTARARVLQPRVLEPGEQYFYRFATRSTSSPVGRFRTALPADSREPVRIGFFSCQNWRAGYYNAHAGLAAEPDLDLVVSLGDYMYETCGASAVPGRDDRTSSGENNQTETLADYRAKYRLYRSDPNLQAVHANHPFVAIWDDHEFENDQEGPKGEGTTAVRRIPYAERRRNAYLGFFENMPLQRIGSDRDRIYRKLRLGANADLFLLDTRTYREPDNSTILGAAQKQWLKAGLERSRAAWKVLGNQVMLMSLDVPTGNPVNPDAWDGYEAERREVVQHVLDKGIRDVTVITGDIHTFFAGTVTTTGRTGGRPGMTEFVGGSITSDSLDGDLGGEDARPITEPVFQAAQLLNPHYAFANFNRRGYGVMECRPGELTVDFKAVDSVRRRDRPVTTLASFRVEAGSTAVQRTR